MTASDFYPTFGASFIAALCAFALTLFWVKRHDRTAATVLVFCLATAATFSFAHASERAIHILPFWSAFLLLYAQYFAAYKLRPLYVWAGSYLSLYIADAAAAFVHFSPRSELWFLGIGGAGVLDTLFIIPLLTTACAAWLGRDKPGTFSLTKSPQ